MAGLAAGNGLRAAHPACGGRFVRRDDGAAIVSRFVERHPAWALVSV